MTAGLIIFGILIFSSSGIISVCILKSALKQKKSCSCGKCWHQNNGTCYHPSPMVDQYRKCISYREAGKPEGDDSYDE